MPTHLRVSLVGVGLLALIVGALTHVPPVLWIGVALLLAGVVSGERGR